MEARIFMKFETYVHKIVLDHQPNFHKDPCKDARARGVNARTHVKKNLCVRSLGYIVGASPPPCENMCVRLLGYIVGASPPCVCPFIGRQSSLDPCMLPTPLCGIFYMKLLI